LLETHYESSIFVQGRSPGGGDNCRVAAPQAPKTEIKKNTHTGFVDIMISNLFRDFPFSRNQPLKSAYNQYIRILRSTRKLIKLKKKEDVTM
jgi:hypothetical protein